MKNPNLGFMGRMCVRWYKAAHEKISSIIEVVNVIGWVDSDQPSYMVRWVRTGLSSVHIFVFPSVIIRK